MNEVLYRVLWKRHQDNRYTKSPFVFELEYAKKIINTARSLESNAKANFGRPKDYSTSFKICAETDYIDIEVSKSYQQDLEGLKLQLAMIESHISKTIDKESQKAKGLLV